MERMVRLTAQQYVKRLPPGQDFYTPSDLYDSDIPDFICERVILEMNFKLGESIVPPHSDWADMAAEGVQEAWQNFLRAIAEEHRLPASSAESVFETAIVDTLEMLLQPRTAIPEAIFGKDETLPLEMVEARANNVTVYKHLTAALLRYMNRKQKTELSFEECKRVIAKVDGKLVEHYNPLSWGQMLEPVFVLAGPSVNSNLFRIFFEDKGRNQIARAFDMHNGALTKNQFVEKLSSPELLGLEDDGEQSELFRSKTGDGDDPVQQTFEAESEETFGDEEEDSILSSFQRQIKRSDEGEEGEDIDHDKPSAEVVQNEEEPQEPEKDDAPLHRRFMFDSDALDEDDIPDVDDGNTSLYKELNLKQDRRFSEDQPFDFEKKMKPEKTTPVPEKDQEAPEDTEDSTPVKKNISALLEGVKTPDEPVSDEVEEEDDNEPIWKAFLEGDSAEIDEEELDDSGFSEGTAFNLSDEVESSPEEKVNALSGWLKDDEERFVSELFGDSEFAYEQALENIYDFNDWKSASRYVEKEIFSRNRVDVYDEVAVDFTDRLHTFFMEFKSSKMNG